MEELNFKAWMVQNKIPQQEIANLLEISLQMTNAKINGREEFTLSQVKKICKEYQISADDYFI